MTDLPETIQEKTRSFSCHDLGSGLSEQNVQKERKNQRKKDIYILLGQVSSLLEEIKERLSSLDQDTPSLGGCGGGFLKRKRSVSKIPPTVTDAQVREVVDKWLELGRNPRDYSHKENRTINSIRKRIANYGMEKVMRAVERIHSCSETTYLPFLANAFGFMNKLAPYYEDNWTAPDESQYGVQPEPRRYVIPDRQEGDVF